MKKNVGKTEYSKWRYIIPIYDSNNLVHVDVDTLGQYYHS